MQPDRRALMRERRSLTAEPLSAINCTVAGARARLEPVEVAMGKYCAIPAYERAGLSRVEAAEYVGVGATLFDEMVADGRMPPSRWANGRRIWLRRELEQHLEDLPTSSATVHDGQSTGEFVIE